MPDETVWRTMLFDFYGDLLTDKQREYYDLHYNQDLSLASPPTVSRSFVSVSSSAAAAARCAAKRRTRPSRASVSRSAASARRMLSHTP